MNLHNTQNELLSIKFLLIAYFTMLSNAHYREHNSIDSRIRQTLTTICAEIEPSTLNEESYLMCKGARIPDSSQRPVSRLSSNNIDIKPKERRNNDDWLRGLNPSQTRKKQIFADLSLPKNASKYLPSIPVMSDDSTHGVQSTSGSNYAQLELALTSLYNRLQYGNVTEMNGNSYPENYESTADMPYTKSTTTPSPISFEASKTRIFNDKNSRPLLLLKPFNSNNNPIETAIPKYIQKVSERKFDTQNLDMERKTREELCRQAVDKNMFEVPIPGQSKVYFQSSQLSATSGKCAAEAKTAVAAPSNQYYRTCQPEPGQPQSSIIISIPCYNPISSRLSNQNFVDQNQYLSQPKMHPLGSILWPRIFSQFGIMPPSGGLPGSSSTLLPTLYTAPELFRYPYRVLGSIPLPFQVPPMNTLPILGQSPYANVNVASQLEDQSPPLFKSSSPTKRPSEMFVSPSSEPILGQSPYANVNGVSQLEDQSPTLFKSSSPTKSPSEMFVLTSSESIELMPDSKEKETTPQLFQEENHTATMATEVQGQDDLHSYSQTEVIGEESTKKILTMIEKARQLQMRHKFN